MLWRKIEGIFRLRFKAFAESIKKAPQTIASSHGAWGEDVAAHFLCSQGMKILERNCRPSSYDRRLEIDIVALEEASNTVVFVEVKQHSSRQEADSRFKGIDDRKRRNLRKAFGAWRISHKWNGAWRFDVVEVYGVPGSKPVIDNIKGASLQPRRIRESFPWRS